MSARFAIVRRQSLRVRFVLAFVALSTLLTTILAVATFFTVRSFLERQRIQSATRQTAFAVLFAREFLAGRPEQGRDLVSLLQTREPFDAMFVSVDASFATSLSLSMDDVPVGLEELVDRRRIGYQIDRIAGARTLVFGAPLREDAALYLFYPLADIDRTMSVLATVLTIGCVVVAIVGLVLARQLTKRVLRPLTSVTGAAQRIAEGLLETRVEAASGDEVGTLAASFNRMAEAVGGMVERERRFVAALAHELRTPLAGLQATSEMLRSHRDEVSPAGREAVDLMAEDVADLRRLVEDLMEVSALDAGSATVRWEDVELRAVIDAHVTKNRRRVRVEGGPVTTWADKARLARIVANLLDNAFEHGNGDEVSVAVGVDRDTCTIAVRDRGPGIDPDDVDRIFAPFFKADRSRTRGRGGVGLGLAIALANARLMGGTIDANATAGEGATFTLRLPRRNEAPEEAS